MFEKIKQYYIILSIGLVVLLIIVGILLKPEKTEAEIFVPIVESERNIETAYIYVDVKGAVANPGVYKIEKGSRMYQVLKMAGGLIQEADVNAINQSIILSDQQVIYVPLIGEELPPIVIDENTNTPGVININTATLEQLETLQGIGPATAQKIIDYRTENGDFNRIEDIMNVSGIGESTFNEIKDSITT